MKFQGDFELWEHRDVALILGEKDFISSIYHVSGTHANSFIYIKKYAAVLLCADIKYIFMVKHTNKMF